MQSRVEQLESDRDTLFAAFRAVDGEFHEAVTRHKSDRKLIHALRTTQIEHSHLLADLVTGQAELKGDVSTLKEGQAELKADVSTLKEGQAKLEQLIRRGFNLPEED